MRTFTASNAACEIFTEREGVLGAVGHDLRLECRTFSIRWDDASVTASFAPDSITVVAPEALSDRDRQQIDRSTRGDVLDSRHFPEITFRSTRVTVEGDAARIDGTLSLHGHARPIVVEARRTPAGWSSETKLHQPDWGIKPFSALFGALKVKPDVVVRVLLRAEAAA